MSDMFLCSVGMGFHPNTNFVIKLRLTKRGMPGGRETYLYLLLRTRITPLPTRLSSVIRPNCSWHGNGIQMQ